MIEKDQKINKKECVRTESIKKKLE